MKQQKIDQFHERLRGYMIATQHCLSQDLLWRDKNYWKAGVLFLGSRGAMLRFHGGVKRSSRSTHSTAGSSYPNQALSRSNLLFPPVNVCVCNVSGVCDAKSQNPQPQRLSTVPALNPPRCLWRDFRVSTLRRRLRPYR